MTNLVLPEVLRKVRKLALLPDEARRGQFAVSITRLTVLKSLCQQPEVASRFDRYALVLEELGIRPGKDFLELTITH